MTVATPPKTGVRLGELPGLCFSAEAIEELCGRANESLTRAYRMCGRTLVFRCNSPEFAARFDNAFRRLRCEPAVDAETSELTFLTSEAGPDNCPALIDRRLGRVRVFAHSEIEPTQLFFCLAFVEEQMFRTDDYAIIHGAAVARSGRVTLLVGLTHSGKSTLGLRLALEPEIEFLSDEFGPIRLSDGSVEPFPRCLGLRRQTRVLLAELGALSADLASAADIQLDVDPPIVRGLNLGREGRLSNVVFVSGAAPSTPSTDDRNLRLLDLDFVTDALLADLRAIPGVRNVTCLDERIGFGIPVRIEAEPQSQVTEAVFEVCRERHGMQFMNYLSSHAARPDFARSPRLTPLAPTQGMMELPRHIINRYMLCRHLGGLGRLIDCLAAVSGGVRFFSLQPGPLEETCRLVIQKVIDP